MYFQIENTPEHIKKSRKTKIVKPVSPEEECPRLVLTPFSRPPQVIFENVLIGSSCQKSLEVFNPSKQIQQITLDKALPSGFKVHLLGEWLLLEPETCYCLTMSWTPTQPTALRETLRFTNENKRRFDVVIVLKTTVAKGKGNQIKGYKISPGKIKKKSQKKSPVNISKKKVDIIYNTTKVKKPVLLTQYKEITSTDHQENYVPYKNTSPKCPFGSPNSTDFKFNTSEVFSVLHKTYDKPNEDTYNCYPSNKLEVPNTHNILKPSNKQNLETSASDIFDNITFTPLKSIKSSSEKLEKGPRMVLSINSDSEYDDSLDKDYNKENDTHSIICVSSSQTTNNRWLTVDSHSKFDTYQETNTPIVSNKKIPNTSSPKEMNSPNFSINTDFSRISELSFFPQRFSTERKYLPKVNNETRETLDENNLRLCSDTFTKESPAQQDILNQIDSRQSFYIKEQNTKMCRQALFKDQGTNSRDFIERNHIIRQNNRDYYDRNHMIRPDRIDQNHLPQNTSDFNERNHIMRHNSKDSHELKYSRQKDNRDVNEQNYKTRQDSMDWNERNNFMRHNNRALHEPNHVTRQDTRDFNERNFINRQDGVWQHDIKIDVRSPPRSLSPPLQSIPEESLQFSETQTLERIDSFVINRTYNKQEKSVNKSNVWSKKAVVKAKSFMPLQESISFTNQIIDTNQSFNQNVTVNYIPNAYSQSLTVDPFLSTTYFYDETLIAKFERDFKRWLNYILTPADLESNVEQKIDVGKAWIENRNKDVPTAPTKEKVCSAYHNNHRLESLRKSARALLKSTEISQVFLKLNAQIDKKLIAIREDRVLHLDVGLQKVIMELLLSYNPLWLRIGLEVIYGTVLPLKSNSDIEGLTTFIIQRLFKNPFLKNKHSKSSAPNVLLPAYMEAIKKFTLKKFFMLVLFLDQAKQKKIIAHDPCLFCRNAACKESRQIIIRFTRELIAGIGDITRHLRPLGYLVSHKQSYLDEYKYGVNDIAIDLKDGVRLTKVTEIILMKDGLLKQLRTPAVSRLQKIHNVEVALKALRTANFTIVGDITATDIVDGHREKTLSLLWQLIHVFRAPLFENAANIIQTWWKKKYEVIAEKRKEERDALKRKNTAAEIIQYWWRQIQYRRIYERRLFEVTRAAITLQKYLRMWICKTRLRKTKQSVLIIEKWYDGAKKIREARHMLKLRREARREYAAIVIQTQIRRWICVRNYHVTLNKIIYIQALVRGYLTRRRLIVLRNATVFVQRKYRSKLLMHKQMANLQNIKNKVVLIQSYYRMYKQRITYLEIKKAVNIIETRYIALLKMKTERNKYIEFKATVIKIQSMYKCKKCQREYQRSRKIIINIQRRIRANQMMRKTKQQYKDTRNAIIKIQRHIKSYLIMKRVESHYNNQRKAAVTIQNYFRSYMKAKKQRKEFVQIKTAATVIQLRYRSLIKMRQAKSEYLHLKNAAIRIQRRYRAHTLMKEDKRNYEEIRKAVISIQNRFRAQRRMFVARSDFEKLKRYCILVQRHYRAVSVGNAIRQTYLKQKESAIKIQRWLRNCKYGKDVKQKFEQTKQACVSIQRLYRNYVLTKTQRREFVQLKTATISIQRYYRNYIISRTIRTEYVNMRVATITIQRRYRSYLETKRQRNTYLKIKEATSYIQVYYRRYRMMTTVRKTYCELKTTAVFVQRTFRSLIAMKNARTEYLTMKKSAILIQRQYRALRDMRIDRQEYLKQRSAAISMQRRFRALCSMRHERINYMKTRTACLYIQRFYRAYKTGTNERQNYIKLREASIVTQRRYRALVLMRTERNLFISKRKAAIVLQTRYRARNLMIQQRLEFEIIVKACIYIQRRYRAFVKGRMERNRFVIIKSSALTIQAWYRSLMEMTKTRNDYLKLRKSAIVLQRHMRTKRLIREQTLIKTQAVNTIANWYITIRKRRQYLEIRRKIVLLQSVFRVVVIRNRYFKVHNAAVKIQTYYRSYVLMKKEKLAYVQVRTAFITLQAHVRSFIERRKYQRLKTAVIAIQVAYRLKKQRDLVSQRIRHQAAICLQKNIRRYLAQVSYRNLYNKVMFIQILWKGKLLTRLLRYEYLQKITFITKLQARVRGYLIRKEIQIRRQNLQKIREEKRQSWAASKIQALFRAHKVRVANDKRVLELRKRWRDGGLESTQRSLKERNEEAMDVLRNMSDIETVIRAFRSLELLTEVFPMMYNSNATSIVHRVYIYMSVTNRSISSIEVLKSAAAVLVNLARYKTTGPKIYLRDRITPVLKFMWRFCNSETHLFCILATYLWLFAKYDSIKKDLTAFLHEAEHHKIMVTIKGNVDRMKRMASNAARHKSSTPQSTRFVSHTMNNSLRDGFNLSVCSSDSVNILLPALEPDYGIVRADKPRYFEDAQQAIHCLFQTYRL